jgi:DNA (cytosine-5)-methyltransferase 1
MKRRGPEIEVDSFAGAGGASLGIARATGRSPAIAINHDEMALMVHSINHPDTRHVLEDVWKANLRKLVGRQRVGLLWCSPDCTDHSRAKGDKPIRDGDAIRSLAWVICKWAAQVRPRVIILENVREYEEWSPLVPQWICKECGWKGSEGQATLVRTRRKCPRCDSRNLKQTEKKMRDPNRKGLIFKRWVGRLRNLGYHAEWKNLDAADFGDPTHRKRLFLVARRDGEFIFWPEPTHGTEKRSKSKRSSIEVPAVHTRKPYRTAAECIDFSLPCPSIFGRKRPIVFNTQRRIAMGCKRYVLENPNPFIVQCNHSGEDFRGQSINEPLPTITKKHGYGLVTPFLSKFHGQKGDESRCRPCDEPINTIDTQNRFALVAPSMVNIERSYGSDEFRGQSVEDPLGTITAYPKGGKHALVSAFLSQFYGNSIGQGVDQPAPTILKQNHSALASVWIAKHYGGVVGHDPNRPLGTITKVDHHSVVSAYLARFHCGEKQWNGVDEPLGTITSKGNKFGLVYAFMVKYYGTAFAAPLDEPMHTQTQRHRFGLVTIEVTADIVEPAVAVFVNGYGWCVITDIGLRMLTPRELARCQGFPDDYQLRGPIYKQVEMIGNSVAPSVAEAVVAANYKPRIITKRRRAPAHA